MSSHPFTPTASIPRAATGPLAAEHRYQQLWRWHFYAGLFVLPLLLILAVTGTLYLFQPQIEAVLYKDKLFVGTPQAGAVRQGYDQLALAAAQSLPSGSVLLRLNINDAPGRSAEFIYQLPGGAKTSVYVNPYTGAVLGMLDVDKRIMQQVRMVHRQLLLGPAGGIVMELAATWTLVMLATGIAMWRPQPGRTNGTRIPALPAVKPKGRAWWRNVHKTIGIGFAAGALFFIVSGMPWSGVWGSNFKAIATQLSFGYPDGTRQPGHIHSAKPADTKLADLPFSNVPWAVGDTQVPHTHDSGHAMPMADMPGMDVAMPPRISLDQAINTLKKAGMDNNYELVVPKDGNDVFTVSYYPADPRGQRTLHVDPYSGQIVSQAGYGQYGFIAKAISFGTALHMGRLFGMANQLLCAAIALALGALCATGLIMWWKRRPTGKLFAPAPARRTEVSTARGWIAGLALLGLVFPMMGLTLAGVALVDGWLFAPPKPAVNGSSRAR